jgi:hypothetical protein
MSEHRIIFEVRNLRLAKPESLLCIHRSKSVLSEAAKEGYSVAKTLEIRGLSKSHCDLHGSHEQRQYWRRRVICEVVVSCIWEVYSIK